MTIKEAIFKSLEELKNPSTYLEIYNHIIKNSYSVFKGETPTGTVSGYLSDFIKYGDTRVRRIKLADKNYGYYLTKNEPDISIDTSTPEIDTAKPAKVEKAKTFDERDLHILLSTYLKNIGAYAKTIFHEQSTFGKDSNQTWTHPDMVGIRFLNLTTKASQNFLKVVNRVDTFKLSSYELKKEIYYDSDLKKAFFQAVSNSSWANYGYLVAFEYSDNLIEEMERLNQSFGIGIIKLHSNPYQSKVLFQPQHRDLDFRTIDKLCKINKEFEKFIEQTEKILTAEDRYYKAMEKELDDFCDKYLTTDEEIDKYCLDKHIPSE